MWPKSFSGNGSLMRNTFEHPITYEEVAHSQEKLALELVAGGIAPGDMRALLLMQGARLIRAIGSGPIPQEFLP